ncbi:hypothetical protein B0H10DRAFT_1974135 [Mycena sp. CBHHK59/15]|nr:hypothetical protein B0H10DRAFT_1974135 [Mycena sp. CBHHK59/15]
MSDASLNHVDVLLVGGGPASLLITSVLVHSGLKILTVEQYDKFEQGLYGRACMLYAGSLEILDLIGVYDRIADIGFTVRSATTFKDGMPTASRGWSFIENALERNKTMFDFSFSICQKHLEDALRDTIAEVDREVVKAPVKLLSYRIVESSSCPVIATIEEGGKHREILKATDPMVTVTSLNFSNATTPTVTMTVASLQVLTVHWYSRLIFFQLRGLNEDILNSKYLVGADGGRSTAVAIKSKKYGNILWTLTDNGRTRIGFICPDKIFGDRGSNITAEIIMGVAKEALLPFTLDFVKLDWWTVYEIGQRVAGTFRDGPVFLAGDTAHTHSSGAAQGMNTGVHDAINLGWKLAGVLSGLYKEEILDTYSSERQKSAERVVELDKDVASLISGKIPDHFHAPPDADPNDYLEEVYSANTDFTVGMGVSYEPNLINQIREQDGDLPSVKIGHRAPDSPVFRPGRVMAQPLRTLIKYTGRFWVLVFAGKLETAGDVVRLNPYCAEAYSTLCSSLAAAGSLFPTRLAPWDFLTLLSGTGSFQPSETLSVKPLGQAVYDLQATFSSDMESIKEVDILDESWGTGAKNRKVKQHEQIASPRQLRRRPRLQHAAHDLTTLTPHALPCIAKTPPNGAAIPRPHGAVFVVLGSRRRDKAQDFLGAKLWEY